MKYRYGLLPRPAAQFNLLTMKVHFLAFLLVFGLALGTSTLSFAQSSGEASSFESYGDAVEYFNNLENGEGEKEKIVYPYDPKYKNSATPVEIESGLISSGKFVINFARSPKNPQSEAILQFIQPVTANGCVGITMPPPKLQRLGPNLKIEVGQPVVQVGQKQTDGIAQCPQSGGNVQTQVALDLNMLLEHNVKRLMIQSDFGLDNFDISADKNQLRLIPKTARIFTANKTLGGRNPLQHIFYPENTLILTAPLAPDEDTLAAPLQQFMKRNGLQPLTQVIADFHPLTKQNNAYYVHDKSGKIARSIQPGQVSRVGTLTIHEDFYGPQGLYKRPKEIDIFARTPGAME